MKLDMKLSENQWEMLARLAKGGLPESDETQTIDALTRRGLIKKRGSWQKPTYALTPDGKDALKQRPPTGQEEEAQDEQ